METVFRPLCPSFVQFVPLSRTKLAFWISTRKPILSAPGSILVDGFDTHLIPRTFSCGYLATEYLCVAVCCSVLQCVAELVALCCSVLQCEHDMMQQNTSDFVTPYTHSATHCNTRQHTATHCNTLQLYTQLHRTLSHPTHALQQTATHCNTLQHTATHGSTLQHTATHYNTLQHTAAIYAIKYD